MKAELVLGNLKRERKALNDKLNRLAEALGKEWQDEDQEYLCTQQYSAMCLYAHILDERITDIEMKLEEKKMAANEAAVHETSHSDDSLFNGKVDPSSYKEYSNSRHSCCSECKLDDGLKTAIVDIIKGIFECDGFTIE